MKVVAAILLVVAITQSATVAGSIGYDWTKWLKMKTPPPSVIPPEQAVSWQKYVKVKGASLVAATTSTTSKPTFEDWAKANQIITLPKAITVNVAAPPPPAYLPPPWANYIPAAVSNPYSAPMAPVPDNSLLPVENTVAEDEITTPVYPWTAWMKANLPAAESSVLPAKATVTTPTPEQVPVKPNWTAWLKLVVPTPAKASGVPPPPVSVTSTPVPISEGESVPEESIATATAPPRVMMPALADIYPFLSSHIPPPIPTGAPFPWKSLFATPPPKTASVPSTTKAAVAATTEMTPEVTESIEEASSEASSEEEELATPAPITTLWQAWIEAKLAAATPISSPTTTETPVPADYDDTSAGVEPSDPEATAAIAELVSAWVKYKLQLKPDVTTTATTTIEENSDAPTPVPIPEDDTDTQDENLHEQYPWIEWLKLILPPEVFNATVVVAKSDEDEIYKAWIKRALVPKEPINKNSSTNATTVSTTTTTKKPKLDIVPLDFWNVTAPTLAPNSTAIDPTFWAAKKSMFVSKLFAALAKVALNATLQPTTSTTESPKDKLLKEIDSVLNTGKTSSSATRAIVSSGIGTEVGSADNTVSSFSSPPVKPSKKASKKKTKKVKSTTLSSVDYESLAEALLAK